MSSHLAKWSVLLVLLALNACAGLNLDGSGLVGNDFGGSADTEDAEDILADDSEDAEIEYPEMIPTASESADFTGVTIEEVDAYVDENPVYEDDVAERIPDYNEDQVVEDEINEDVSAAQEDRSGGLGGNVTAPDEDPGQDASSMSPIVDDQGQIEMGVGVAKYDEDNPDQVNPTSGEGGETDVCVTGESETTRTLVLLIPEEGSGSDVQVFTLGMDDSNAADHTRTLKTHAYTRMKKSGRKMATVSGQNYKSLVVVTEYVRMAETTDADEEGSTPTCVSNNDETSAGPATVRGLVVVKDELGQTILSNVENSSDDDGVYVSPVIDLKNNHSVMIQLSGNAKASNGPGIQITNSEVNAVAIVTRTPQSHNTSVVKKYRVGLLKK